MSESEAAKVAGRLQKDGALDSWEPMAALFDQIRDQCLTVIRERDEARAQTPLHELADADQVAHEVEELRRQLAETKETLWQVTAHRNRAIADAERLQKLADKTALAAADRTLQAEHSGELGRVQELERQLAAAQRQTEAEVEHGNDLARQLNKVEGEIAELAQQFANAIDILKDAYVAREVPWTDVAAGMMTIARDGTPWMVEAYDELGTWTLRNGAKRFEKEPMNGETVRVLVPYVTPEQAEELVRGQLGGTEVGA